MSAFRTGHGILPRRDDQFTFAAFQQWMKGPNSRKVHDRIVSWLPNELFPDAEQTRK